MENTDLTDISKLSRETLIHLYTVALTMGLICPSGANLLVSEKLISDETSDEKETSDEEERSDTNSIDRPYTPKQQQ